MTRPDLPGLANAPDFAAWQTDTLARFAADAYRKLQEQEHLIADLRLDLRDAMRLMRELNRSPAP